jgi:hypothetical protein
VDPNIRLTRCNKVTHVTRPESDFRHFAEWTKTCWTITLVSRNDIGSVAGREVRCYERDFPLFSSSPPSYIQNSAFNLATAILLHIFTSSPFVILSLDAVKFEQTINDANFMLRSALFWGITQRRVVIFYRRFGTTYRSHLKGSRSPLFLAFFPLDDGTETLSRNVGNGLPLDDALYPRRAQISSALRRKPEISNFMLFIPFVFVQSLVKNWCTY